MKGKAHFQQTLASQSGFEKYGRKSRREEFLSLMESVVPWRVLEAVIELYYPKAGNGRQPVGLSIMLRVYFCSSGSICPIPEPKTRCTSLQYFRDKLPHSITQKRAQKTARKTPLCPNSPDQLPVQSFPKSRLFVKSRQS